MRSSLPPRTPCLTTWARRTKEEKMEFPGNPGRVDSQEIPFFFFFFSSFFSSSTAFSPPRIKNQRDGGDGEVGRCAAGSRVTGERGVVKCDVTPFLVLTSFHSFFSLFRLFLPPCHPPYPLPLPLHPLPLSMFRNFFGWGLSALQPPLPHLVTFFFFLCF